MYYFNVSFSNILDRSNIKIKTLAEQTGVDRASIYQYRNGKSLPSKEFLDKFVSVMQLSVSEEKELREAYKIAKIGVPTYIKRNQLKRCFEILNDSINDSGQISYKPSTAQIRLPESTTGFEGREKITLLVKNVIDYEFAIANELSHKANIKTFIPSDYNEFYQHLSELYHSHKSMTINFEPIIRFAKNGNSENNNIIDAVSSIMYFLFTGCPGYNPRFYYDENNFLDSVGILYPYYIITSCHLILLDVNLIKAQFICEPNIISLFSSRFNDVCENTKPLIQRFNSLIDITDMFIYKAKTAPEILTLCAGSGSCMEKFADANMILKYLDPEIKERDHILRYMQQINSPEVTNHQLEFQSSGAITEFAETGYIKQIDSVLKSRISLEDGDRKFLLTEALRRPREDMGYVIDSNKIKLPPITLFVTKNDCVIMYMDIMSDVLIISEPEIANAFFDFFCSLIDTECILSPMELSALILKAITICNNKASNIESNEETPKQ